MIDCQYVDSASQPTPPVSFDITSFCSADMKEMICPDCDGSANAQACIIRCSATAMRCAGA